MNKDYAEANPKVATFMKGLQISVADLSAMMTRMNDGENSPEQLEQIGKDWIAANQASWDALIAKASAM